MTCKNHKKIDYSCTTCCKSEYKKRVEEIKKTTDAQRCGKKHPEGQECQQCQDADLESLFQLLSSIDPRILRSAYSLNGFIYEGRDPEGNSGVTSNTKTKKQTRKPKKTPKL